MGARIDMQTDRVIVWNANPARRNALTPDYYAALTRTLTEARGNAIAAVIVTGEGGFFCAGGDLTTLGARAALTQAERQARIEALHDLIRAIRACPCPVIAAVEGGAAGAGLSLALACDLLVSADDAKFTAAYVKAGLVPDGGLTASLLARLPPSLAAQMCLLGTSLTADRLHALGVINTLTPPGRALDGANALADQLASGPRTAQAAIKRLLIAAGADAFQAQLDRERDAMATALGLPEAAEGIAAFLDRRTPDFAAARGRA